MAIKKFEAKGVIYSDEATVKLKRPGMKVYPVVPQPKPGLLQG